MHPTQQEFYDRLNELDREDSTEGFAFIALAATAIFGFIVGFLSGYFIGCWLGG